MDPLSGRLFSHDDEKFIYQPYLEIPQKKLPKKPFFLSPPKKTSGSKKDTDKEKEEKR